jgi:uncharacterized protein with beta-barrel porin domain
MACDGVNMVRAPRRDGFRLLASPALLTAALSLLGATQAAAQFVAPPTYTDTRTGLTHQSSGAALFDAGSRFLDRLGPFATSSASKGANYNPEGGGADAPAQQRYRAWFETYAMQSRTGAQGTFTGDERRAYGGIAGIGAVLAPGLSVGASVDQGRTKVSVTGAPQGATIDLTQLGLNASYETGSWTFGAALIHGFGNIDSARTSGPSQAVAGYGARLWGAVAEANYFIPLPNNSRLVPKAGLDWLSTRVDGFTETGGIDPVTVQDQSSNRTRLFAGAELGHSWLVGRTIYDLAAYGKMVDVVSQQSATLQLSSVTGAALPTTIQGVQESRFGFETGTTGSVFLTETARLYAIYDGKFREGFQQHGGTLGLELKW